MKIASIRLFLSLLILTLGCAHQPQSTLIDFQPQKTVLRGPSTADPSCLDILKYLEFSNFTATTQRLDRALVQIYGRQNAEKARRNIDALYFVDYVDAYEYIMNIRHTDTLLTHANFDSIYRHGRTARGKTLPFLNHRNALDELISSRGEFNAGVLKNVHKKMMSGGVDGIPQNRLGTYRKEAIIGNAEDFPVSRQGYEALEENPYISTADLRRVTRREAGETIEEYKGQILYPSIDSMTDEVKAIVRRKDAALYQQITRYQRTGQGSEGQLNEKLMNVLVEDLMEWFVRQRNQIGEIRTDAKFRRYVKLVAEFQRNLISIHPFYDGNGRTSRVFALYYPFLRENLPPPRIVNANADIERSLEAWTDQIAQGVESTKKLYEDLIYRTERGFRLEHSPDLAAPVIPNRAMVGFKQERPRRVVQNHREIDVVPQEFVEHMEIILQADPALARLSDVQPDVFFREMGELHRGFVRRNRLFYVHPNHGEEKLALYLADQDFIFTFGDQSYRNGRLWRAKMKDFYDDQVIWRGLADQHHEVTEAELVSMFRDPNSHFVSNNVLRKMNSRTTRDKMVELIIEDFEQYNSDVIGEGLVRMARDHSETGPLYGQSYGYSTSKNRTVGKAFAMGAMVVADYGQHQGHQHLLKSRVLVGMQKAKKDVDLTRLKQLRDEFSYKYGRQQEVMGVGGADPDSVMFVQTIDADGSVILSYVRSPENPHKIYVIRGEASEWPVPTRGPNFVKIIELD
jgi:hypothetical protein